ncbi:putative sodium-coupled neutral amino acid transporter 11 [Cynoglossus semilaevis]|uniref:putative sodium-coupled neutral amino acid transporter 11 n=1 Tax=Cynoglossus semilaevis TaxID=244447 RepID=UPI000D624531|nr:putative sodium-coupled neutral amino acid transporter 11 [Cynoglossus semilaevis]
MTQQRANEEAATLIPLSGNPGESRRSMISATFNFINSIVGSGIVGLPYALNQAGLPFGLLLLIAVGFITGVCVSLVMDCNVYFQKLESITLFWLVVADYSIILLIKGGELSGTNSYQSLVQSTFGLPGFLILSALQFLYPFIAMISYNITTGDTLTKVFQRIPGVGPGHPLADRHFVIILTTILFTLPLSLYRNIARLGKVSFFSMVLTLIILIVAIVRAATLGPEILPTEDAWTFARLNSIQAVGVMSFAFICHHNSFLIYGSLEKPTLAKWAQVTHVSVGSALFISAVFAVAGYTTFTGFTQGDIFENYCRDDNLATFGRFCFALSIITTFPLECFVTREVTTNVICNQELSRYKHLALTTLIVTVCTSLSLTFDCLGVVLELNGVLSATPLIFIIPSACFLKLSPGSWLQGEKLLSIILIVIGLFVMIIGLTMTGLFPQDCSHGVEMFYCPNANVTGTAPPV